MNLSKTERQQLRSMMFTHVVVNSPGRVILACISEVAAKLHIEGCVRVIASDMAETLTVEKL